MMQFNAYKSQILICKNLDKLNHFLSKFEGLSIEISTDVFLMENAKSVLKESYLKSDKLRRIILIAKEYKEEAQNALLKLLEETPSGLFIYIVTPSKNIIIDTIKSRLPLFIIDKSSNDFIIDSYLLSRLKNIDYECIYRSVDLYSKMDRQELLDFLKSLLKAFLEEKIPLNKKQLEAFWNSYELISLNANKQAVLNHLFLTLQASKK